MNTTHSMFASVSLGLMASVGGFALAEGGSDPRVEMIEFPGDSTRNANLHFSGDGSTIVIGTADATVDLYVHRGADWVHTGRVVYSLGFDLVNYGISDNGEAIGITDFQNTTIVENALTTTLPRRWSSSDYGELRGYLHGRALSGDGLVVGADGDPYDASYRDAVIWNGGVSFVNISEDLPQDRVNYFMKALDEDGSVAVFGASYSARHNNIRLTSTERDTWVWDEGELTMIPTIDPGYDVFMRAREVSGNGEAVIGNAEGRWRPGFGGEDQLHEVDPYGIGIIGSPNHAWIWTQESGTVEIADPDRFDSVGALDITDDACVVLGNAKWVNSEKRDQFLWYGEGKFVIVGDLLSKIGVSIDADWYSFYQISGDGSMLMGLAKREDHFYAIKVVIPVR
ncbi:hypothetical protein COB72_02855 [bacterium]|nr:MAG: hypothetical protein COB72_02855 [bacterium]